MESILLPVITVLAARRFLYRVGNHVSRVFSTRVSDDPNLITIISRAYHCGIEEMLQDDEQSSIESVLSMDTYFEDYIQCAPV